MQDDQEPDDIDEIIGAVSYEAALPNAKKQFLPWHRPRKQFVRDRQWREQIARLLPELQDDNDVIKYLGLPGTDLLDLRYFHDSLCITHNKKLFYTGFNSVATPLSADGIELNISLDEVNKLPLVQPGSEVIADDFRMVANPSSYAYKQTSKHGPYDVVNLDLCDGFACQSPTTMEPTHYNAMSQLLAIQSRRKTPWLLLLTTRVGINHVHRDVLENLVNKFNENLNSCETFRNLSTEHFNIQNQDQLNQAIKNTKGLGDVFLASICKWLLGISINQNPPTKIELKSVIGYRVEDTAEELDLVSLAIKFTPTLQPTPDPMGLAKNHPKPPTECDFAPSFVAKVARRVDADNVLSSNQEIMKTMSIAMGELLALARYDVNEFHIWVQQGCPVQ